MMARRSILIALTVTLLGGCGADEQRASSTTSAPSTALPQLIGDPTRLAGHVHFLADDALEGREAGTRGYDLAAAYVASQFAAIGLTPGGDDGGWLQQVPLLQATRLAEGAELRIDRDDGAIVFRFEAEYVPGINYHQPRWRLSAPLVFVGQAVVAPEFEHDDLKGVDLRGKIAVWLSGAPARFPDDHRAFYASGREKLRLLAERGAVGSITIGDPENEAKSPWARGVANWARPQMRLRDVDGQPIDTQPQLVASASMSVAAAERLFAGAPMDATEVYRRLQAGELQAFDLPGIATLAGAAELVERVSHNVVAQLPGNDAQRATEQVVFSAHLDHVGIGAPINGDAIYNGALDNALGVGLLLETARLAHAGPQTARGRVFVALTAEEKGLLGAEHFAAQPGLPGRLVANINMDMPVVLGPRRDVLPIGIEHSSLQAVVEAAAAELDVELSANPFPEESVFVRSDQYAFIRRGVPALYLKGGIQSTEAGVDGAAQLAEFLRTHYHQPSDDVSLPIHYPTAARLADLNHRIGLRVGNDADAPRWNEGNFFGERFAGGG
jgi:hypothetical protein